MSVYKIVDIARLTGKSQNLIYRRLTEKNRRYVVKFSRKEGDRWVFDKVKVDNAITNGEPIIVKSTEVNVCSEDTALKYFFKESRSCGKRI